MVIQTCYVEDNPTGKVQPASRKLQAACSEMREHSRALQRLYQLDLTHATQHHESLSSPKLSSEVQYKISALRCDLRA